MRKDILIKVNTKTSRVDLPTDVVGITGENIQGKLKFQLDEFIEGVGTLLIHQEYDGEEHEYFVEMDKEDELYTLEIRNSLLKGWKVDLQLKITEPESAEHIPVFKSNKFFLKVEPTIEADTEIPDEYESWIDTANAKIVEINSKISEADDKIAEVDDTITQLDEDVESGRFNGDSITNVQIINGELIITIDKVVE